MLVFVDESGDTGLKLQGGSSKYFVVALVAFADLDQALVADERIVLLRQEMGLNDRFEFHFNKMKPPQRRQFLSTLAAHEFFYRAVVINKTKLVRHADFQLKHSLYQYACGLVFENAKPRLDNSTVVIDGSDNRDFCKQLRTYLGPRLKDDSGKCLIKKLKTQDSAKSNLLQLTDMVVGAIARAYSRKGDARDISS